MSVKVERWFLFGAVLLAARLCGAGTASNYVAKLEPTEPFPALRAAAQAKGVPLEGIDAPARGDALCGGDSFTALVTLHEKGRRCTQWIIYFQATNGAKEASSEKRDPMVLYTSTGRKFEFAGSPASMGVRTIGPFAEPKSRRSQPACIDKSARVSVNKDFLSLGFDRGAAAVIRWGQCGRPKSGTNFMDSFSFSPKPFDSPRIDHARQLAEQFQVTPEEERSVAGWIPALGCYFNTAGQTPNLKSIMRKVLNLPSLWSFIRNGGVKVGINIEHDDVRLFSPAGWGMPSDGPVYALPAMLTINGHHALALTLIVTAPRPPLLACGGIIGLLAENPEDAENYMTLRVISAHGGSGTAEKNQQP
jgi:hypothetical protein